MSAETKIEWTDRTWNPVRGCSRVSPGCDNCYAMGQAHRFAGKGKPYEGLTTLRKGRVDWSGEARFILSALAEPLSWRKPQRVFVNSMSDLFHHSVTNEEIAAVFGVMAACPHLTFQVLTKRAERMRQWFEWVSGACDDHAAGYPNAVIGHAMADALMDRPLHTIPTQPEWTWPLPNVWLGVSAEDQQRADERIPHLLATPAAVRFVSAEPLLGPIDLRPYLHRGSHAVCPRCLFATNSGETTCPNDGADLCPDIAIDWVIVGGEGGNGARVCSVEWIASIVEQCRAAGVACFVKQLGQTVRVADEDDGRDWGTGVSQHETEPYFRLEHRKGGDPDEWPEDLRVRQFPEVRP